mmetsp:Transcript_16007/g.24226  ORF Transcript_16007/g.24226 Transcript_16007/m.24226 type:complete len:399 (-) Transcript_16007:141-1337(-)
MGAWAAMPRVALLLFLALLCCSWSAIASAVPPRTETIKLQKDFNLAAKDYETNAFVEQHDSIHISREAGKESDAALVIPVAGTMKLTLYLTVWYVMSIFYNVFTKRTSQMIQLPWTLSAVQFGIGSAYAAPIWLSGLRKAPRLSFGDLDRLAPMTILNVLTLGFMTIGLGSGSVSFVNIVKATEPIFSCIFARTLLKEHLRSSVYATLIPIIAGVCLASLGELSFTFTAFGGAMGSSLTSALRGILAKKSLNKPLGKNMTPENLCAVLNITGFLLLAPIALLLEGRQYISSWKSASQGFAPSAIVMNAVLSGAALAVYYEANYKFLGEVNAVTHAVANVMRRILMIATSVLVFGTKIGPLNMLGSVLACAGAFSYSVVKARSAPKVKSSPVQQQCDKD